MVTICESIHGFPGRLESREHPAQHHDELICWLSRDISLLCVLKMKLQYINRGITLSSEKYLVTVLLWLQLAPWVLRLWKSHLPIVSHHRKGNILSYFFLLPWDKELCKSGFFFMSKQKIWDFTHTKMRQRHVPHVKV